MEKGIDSHWKPILEAKFAKNPELASLDIRGIIAKYTPFVKLRAGKLKGLAKVLRSYSEYQDLVSGGTLGILKAIPKFDPERKVKFMTFAVSYIEGYMLSTIFGTLPITRSRAQESYLLNKVIRSFADKGVKAPTKGELANALGVKIDKLEKIILNNPRSLSSLDQPIRKRNTIRFSRRFRKYEPIGRIN